MKLNKQLRGRLALTTAVMAVFASYGRRAYAACSGGAGTYDCSGATTGPVSLSGSPLTVTTSGAFNATSGAGGFYLSGTNGVNFNNSTGGSITATSYGIYSSNTGTSGTSITSTGDIVSTGRVGIEAVNFGAGGTTINVGSVSGAMTGYNFGIQTWNYNGALNITSTGTVSGNTGMFLRSTGGPVTINANNVTGVTYALAVRSFGGGATTITTTGDVVGSKLAGISAHNYVGTTDLTINSATTTGGIAGIAAFNEGTGDTSITTSGTTTGNGDYSSYTSATPNWPIAVKGAGIFAQNGAAARNLTITTNGATTGFGSGIYANNQGTGATTITTNGAVTGSGTSYKGAGIRALNGTTATDLTINAADVTGPQNQAGQYGIHAYNEGTGATTVTTTGTVTGYGGILAWNAPTSPGSLYSTATNLKVTASGPVIGTGTSVGAGINALNLGTGYTSISATGPVTGGGVGIAAGGGKTTTDLSVYASGSVTGGTVGIDAANLGSGTTTVTTTGTVTGSSASGYGIAASNIYGAGLTVKAYGSVTGGRVGIGTVDTDGGATTIIATGAVTGGTTGITSQNAYDPRGLGYAQATDLTITTSGPVTGGQTGIAASNAGTGATTITTTGAVTGTSTAGIVAINQNTATSLTITSSGPVTGGAYGIEALNLGTGTTTVTAGGTVTGTSAAGIAAIGYTPIAINVEKSGLVQGGATGILVYPVNGQAATITNAGTIQNLSGASDALAIASQGTGSAAIANTGLVTGTVNLRTTNNSFDNQAGGVWNTAGGANVLGPDTSSSVNNEAGGTIIAAASGASGPTATSFSGLGTFTNGGLLQMQNGVVGDTTTIAGNFVGTGGTVSLDTQLGGDGSPTDRLIINGDASGSTTLAIRNAGGAGAQTTNGIEVVEINGGTSTADAFHLASAVAVGAYDYALYYQDLTKDDQNWYLRSTGQANASAQTALPYADILVNFADATLGTLQQRTGNRIWPNGTPQVAADLPSSQVMKYAATGPVIYGQGAWGRIGGQYTSIDPKSGTPYTLSLGFLQAGYEGTAYETGAGDLTVGAYAMVGTSHADIDVSRDPATGAARSGKITTTGYGLGGNLTWLGADGLYADAVGQLTFYESSLSNKAGGDNQGWSGTASLEIGKRFELGSGWSVVPQAQLAYTHVDFDSFTDINSSRVTLGDGDSLRGRLGLRVENNASWKNGEGKTDRLQIYGIANLSYGFLKDTSVVVAGTSLEQQDKRLWGEIGAGGTYAWNDNWSVYGEADYATALSGSGSNYSLRGTAGLRYRW